MMRAALIGGEGPVRGQEFPLDADMITIGRREGNTIVVKDPTVSRQHAAIRREGRDFVLRDLGSTDGVHVNGTPIGGEYRLRDGDRIAIGASATFTARLPAPAAGDDPPPDATPGLLTAPEMSEETRLGMVFAGPAPQVGAEAIFRAPDVASPPVPTAPVAPPRSRRGLLIGLLVLLVVLAVAVVAVALIVARR